jgi:hypothetical protein
VIALEHGTFRLAWTQSITRRRWLTTKLVLIAAGALVAALIMTLLLTCWRIPFDRSSRRIDKFGFEFEELVPFAYTVFTAALVIALGAVLRRTAPAVALALIGFIAARVVVGFLPPHSLTPISATWSGGQPTSGPDLRTAWLTSQDLNDAHGHTVHNPPSIADACESSITTKLGDSSCLAQHGVFNHAVYQPASRFWLFQGIEAAIFLALALALAGFAAWWVRDRIS